VQAPTCCSKDLLRQDGCWGRRYVGTLVPKVTTGRMNAGGEGMQNLPVAPKVHKVRMDAGDPGDLMFLNC
jgi:hypothetical protein